uniref:Uncharacterized protein LOC105046059 isoform X1 n=1 Tax=Elaeis guineensis var. tenera TaxID=51953 RepID=A0A6J0PKH6_ELAGV|nr:uncharacterized protein LOC105046059 isoform X1 [Elaeis guineensis]
MAGPGRSMVYSLLLFATILSLLEMYRGKLASSELLTIFGGFISSLLFLVLLTFIGNYQESSGMKTGWGAVVLAEIVALIAASTVHRVCVTTWWTALWIGLHPLLPSIPEIEPGIKTMTAFMLCEIFCILISWAVLTLERCDGPLVPKKKKRSSLQNRFLEYESLIIIFFYKFDSD